MSDILSPESATASLTAASAWAASGISAERVTFEKPTPLTATLHRFSHMWVIPSQSVGPAPFVLRDSRFRGFLRMRFFFNAIKKLPHPEEPAQRASRRTQG